jgi:hypothetical protein
MARTSSMMARVRRNSLAVAGTREPSRARIPSAKAVSVATGTPQPRAPSPPPLRARKTAAGTSMPPTAARAGAAVRRGRRSSPVASSRLISRPTTKKNSVISPSLTQWRRSSVMASPPIPTVTFQVHMAW